MQLFLLMGKQVVEKLTQWKDINTKVNNLVKHHKHSLKVVRMKESFQGLWDLCSIW